jgi:hypothetical protein
MYRSVIVFGGPSNPAASTADKSQDEAALQVFRTNVAVE